MLMLYAAVALLSVVSSASRVPRSCGTCDQTACDALPADGCATGTARDACGCCVVCNAAEGEPCGGRGVTARRCAAGLECVKSDKDKKSKAGGVCACKANYEVCGGDGVTYKTGCELKAASARAVADGQTEIKVQNKGRCATGGFLNRLHEPNGI